ncbi:hypothetical protein FRC11_006671, partial [Ceratobasidium sp. 423]
MRLYDVTHLEVLAERVLAKDVPDSLSVPTHLRCLKFGGHRGWIDNKDLYYLDFIVPQMVNLNCLHWKLPFMPANFHWFSTCPELKSVHLSPHVGIGSGFDNWIGDVDPDWSGFASSTPHALREFLARHALIQDFAIGYPLEPLGYGHVDPNNLPQLLPSVKHFACPSFMCEALIKSKLATQLESLAITDPSLDDDESLGSLVSAMTEDMLPKLRKLRICAYLGYYVLEAEVFGAFFSAAKGLEELEFHADMDDY